MDQRVRVCKNVLQRLGRMHQSSLSANDVQVLALWGLIFVFFLYRHQLPGANLKCRQLRLASAHHATNYGTLCCPGHMCCCTVV